MVIVIHWDLKPAPNKIKCLKALHSNKNTHLLLGLTRGNNLSYPTTHWKVQPYWLTCIKWPDLGRFAELRSSFGLLTISAFLAAMCVHDSWLMKYAHLAKDLPLLSQVASVCSTMKISFCSLLHCSAVCTPQTFTYSYSHPSILMALIMCIFCTLSYNVHNLFGLVSRTGEALYSRHLTLMFCMTVKANAICRISVLFAHEHDRSYVHFEYLFIGNGQFLSRHAFYEKCAKK